MVRRNSAARPKTQTYDRPMQLVVMALAIAVIIVVGYALVRSRFVRWSALALLGCAAAAMFFLLSGTLNDSAPSDIEHASVARIPLIATSTCWIAEPIFSEYVVDGYVNASTELTLPLSPPESLDDSPLTTTLSERTIDTCPVTATLTASDPELTFSNSTRHVDLGLSGLSWRVAAGNPGTYTLVATVESADACISACLTPWDFVFLMRIDVDPTFRSARESLEQFASELDLSVADDQEVSATKSSQLELVVTAGEDRPSNVNDLRLEIRPSDAVLDVTEQSLLIGTGPRTSEILVDAIVNPESDSDTYLHADLVLTGTISGEPIDVTDSAIFPLDVKERSWFSTSVVDNLGTILAALTIGTTIGGLVIAGWRKLRSLPSARGDGSSGGRRMDVDGYL